MKSYNGKLMLRGSVRLSACLALYNFSLSQVSFAVQSCVYYAKALEEPNIFGVTGHMKAAACKSAF